MRWLIALALISTACDEPDEPKREDTTLADPPNKPVDAAPVPTPVPPEQLPPEQLVPAPVRDQLANDGSTTLSINVIAHSCHVLLNDTDLGTAPIFQRHVREGTYDLTLRCTDGHNETRSVTVIGGTHNKQVFMPDR